MRRAIAITLTALGLFWPGAALAAPTSTADYADRMRSVVQNLERATTTADATGRTGALNEANGLLPDVDEVATEHGVTPVDNRYLRDRIERAQQPGETGRRALAEAVAAAKGRLTALDQLNTQQPSGIDARAEDRARLLYQAQKVRNSWWERFVDWLVRLFSGRELDVASPGRQVQDRNRLLMWLAAGVGVLGTGLLAYGMLRGTKPRTPIAGGQRQPDRPATPDDLWQEAKADSALGDHLGALRKGYIALLRHYDEKGVIRYLPSLTNWEHERQLRRKHPGLASQLQPLTALLESRLYAGQTATADDFARGATMIEALWREGDAVSASASPATGSSSSAPSR